MKSNRKKAEQLYETYSIIISNLSKKATQGNSKAAMQVLKEMTERNLAIQKLGFHVGFYRKNIVTNRTHRKHVKDFNDKMRRNYEKILN